MSEVQLSGDESTAVEIIITTDCCDPVQIIRATNFDAGTFFEYGVWEGVDFSRSELNGVSFQGADIVGARFRDDQISQVLSTKPARYPIEYEAMLSRERGTKSAATLPNIGQRIPLKSGFYATDFLPNGVAQRTIQESVEINGVGLHSGKAVGLRINPADANKGVWFERTDIKLGDRLIQARWDYVERTPLCTRIINSAGVSVSTIEHLMSAIHGCGLHNLVIELDGPEVPILDGSARTFVETLIRAGIRHLGEPIQAIEVLRPVEVSREGAVARLEPCNNFAIEFEIDFEDEAIGKQSKSMQMNGGSFIEELCLSRTFSRRSDVEAMRANGLALGGTLENSVIVDGEKVLTPGGTRYIDEPVRHKMLDAIGDLALAGAPIIGKFSGHRSGHALTNTLLRELFASPSSFRICKLKPNQASLLLGFGIRFEEINKSENLFKSMV